MQARPQKPHSRTSPPRAASRIAKSVSRRDGEGEHAFTDPRRRNRRTAILPATAQADYTVETVVEGLANPWSMVFLPDSRMMLVSERPGRIQLIDRDSGEMHAVSGVPEVHAEGQGGLLDLALHPDYPEEPWLYMSSLRVRRARSLDHLCRTRAL